MHYGEWLLVSVQGSGEGSEICEDCGLDVWEKAAVYAEGVNLWPVIVRCQSQHLSMFFVQLMQYHVAGLRTLDLKQSLVCLRHAHPECLAHETWHCAHSVSASNCSRWALAARRATYRA